MESTNFDCVEVKDGYSAYIFAGKERPMIELDKSVYMTIAKSVIDAIAEKEFFNGSVIYSDGVYEYKLTATLIVYYSEVDLPEGVWRVMSNIIPVWWEFSVFSEAEGVILDDFCFTELKSYIFDHRA